MLIKIISNHLPDDIFLVANRNHNDTDIIFDIEKKYFANTVPKRKKEFLNGRSCARKALEHFGVPPCPIPAGENREPVWPAGYVGSITHCDGFCAAAVASANRYRSLGIDAECLQALSPEIRELILTDTEMSGDPDILSDAILVCIIFSAKESVFKCLFPLVKRFFDFKDIDLSIDRTHEKFHANLATDLANVIGKKTLEGTYCLDEVHVFTAVFLEQ